MICLRFDSRGIKLLLIPFAGSRTIAYCEKKTFYVESVQHHRQWKSSPSSCGSNPLLSRSVQTVRKLNPPAISSYEAEAEPSATMAARG